MKLSNAAVVAASCDFIGSGWNQLYDRYFAWLCLGQTAMRRRTNPFFSISDPIPQLGQSSEIPEPTGPASDSAAESLAAQ